jgi:serine/threonine protein kinase
MLNRPFLSAVLTSCYHITYILEYAGGIHASMYGDVYSFGVILLEMLTGKRPTDPIFKDGLNIINFVERSFPDHVWQVIDAHIQEECKKLTQAMADIENVTLRCLMSLLQVALSCTRQIPMERINMKDIATKMHAIKAIYDEGRG